MLYKQICNKAATSYISNFAHDQKVMNYSDSSTGLPIQSHYDFGMQSFAYDAYGYLAYALYNRTRLFNPVAK